MAQTWGGRGTPPERLRAWYLNTKQLRYPSLVVCPRCAADPEFTPACLLCTGTGRVSPAKAAAERRRKGKS